MNYNLKEYLEQKLKAQYAKNDDEWVEIYITPLNRIDVTIVSDGIFKVNRVELEKTIKQLTEEYTGNGFEKYDMGFVNLYTVDDAYDLHINKVEIRETPITWSDVVELNSRVPNKVTEKPYRVISFYSYKGGVGRTTSMVQTAYILAKQGKRVVLVDLDLEAPSLHLMFKQAVTGRNGVKYGLVDYLYERTVAVDDSDCKIETKDVYAPVKFDERLFGSVYVLPAVRELDSEYVYKATHLQSSIIYNNMYLEQLLDSLERDLKFDTVLIDSRTGINQWGAFSLLGFADQIALIASPNSENVEGLRNVIGLMDKAGIENYVVAMSKIPTVKGAREIAKEHVEKLVGKKQEFIGIFYDNGVATAEEYPVLGYLQPYEGLADYIWENSFVDFNVNYLKQKDISDILDKVFNKGTRYIPLETALCYEISNSSVIVCEKDKVKDCLLSIFKNNELTRNLRKRQESDFRDGSGKYSIHDIKFSSELKNYLTSNETNNFSRIFIGYLVYVINKHMNIKTIEEFTTLKDISLLVGKGLKACLEYIESLEEEQVINIAEEFRGIFGQIIEGISNVDSCMLFELKNIEFYFSDFEGLLENLNNKELITSLIECIKFCREYIPEIRIVFFISHEFYNEHTKLFEDLKGNILEIEWKENDVELLVSKNLDENFASEYRNALKKEKHKFGMRADEKDGWAEIREDVKILFKKLDPFWGIRTNPKKFGQRMSSWFYNELKELGRINADMVNNVIQKAIEYELQITERQDPDRLVSLESFEKAFEYVKNNGGKS